MEIIGQIPDEIVLVQYSTVRTPSSELRTPPYSVSLPKSGSHMAHCFQPRSGLGPVRMPKMVGFVAPLTWGSLELKSPSLPPRPKIALLDAERM